MISTLIIDDEADGRDALKSALEKYCPDVDIKGVCETPDEAIQAIVRDVRAVESEAGKPAKSGRAKGKP